MEKIRGVSCDYSVQKLLEKELVAIIGRSDAPGRPLLYGTSEKFMDYFGLKSLEDMPKPKDFKDPDNEIGEQAPIDEAATAALIAELPTDDAQPTANEDVTDSEDLAINTDDTEETTIIEDAIPTEAADTTTLSEDVTDSEDLAINIDDSEE